VQFAGFLEPLRVGACASQKLYLQARHTLRKSYQKFNILGSTKTFTAEIFLKEAIQEQLEWFSLQQQT
jgi:hypothetical protein